MSLPPAVDCIGFCVVCVVNIISFPALGTDRTQERSLSAKVTILTHLSGFAASCVTAAGHKADSYRFSNRSWMQRSYLNAGESGTVVNSCLVTSATLVPMYFPVHDWRDQIIFFSVAPKIDKRFLLYWRFLSSLLPLPPSASQTCAARRRKDRNSSFYSFQMSQVR